MALGDCMVGGMARGSVYLIILDYIGFGTSLECCTGTFANRAQAQYPAVALEKKAVCCWRCLMGNATASVSPRPSAVAAALLPSMVE